MLVNKNTFCTNKHDIKRKKKNTQARKPFSVFSSSKCVDTACGCSVQNLENSSFVPVVHKM